MLATKNDHNHEFMRPNDAEKKYNKNKTSLRAHHIFIETKNGSYISTTITVIRCRPYLQNYKRITPLTS